MANTATIQGNTVNVVLDGSGDFDMADYWPNGLHLTSVALRNSGAGDTLQVREHNADGNVFCFIKDPDGTGDFRRFNGMKRMPYIKLDDCVFDTIANALIIFEFK